MSIRPEYFGHRDPWDPKVSTYHDNTQRDDTYAQPLGLERRDTLANGLVVSDRVLNTDDGARIMFEGGIIRHVPQRLPLKLAHIATPTLLGEKIPEPEVLPEDLRVGDVLQTGCVVLEDPVEATDGSLSSVRDDIHRIRFSLSGGTRPQPLSTPADLYVARFGNLRDMDKASEVLKYRVNEKLLRLRKSILSKALGEFPIIEELLAQRS